MSSNPDYDKLNTDVDIFYEFESDALFASGEVLDYGAYAATSCDDSRVRVGIAFRYWNDINIWQKLGLMYHEFGHDVLRYAHSSNPDDIMHPSSPFASSYNGFIESKNRFFDNYKKKLDTNILNKHINKNYKENDGISFLKNYKYEIDKDNEMIHVLEFKTLYSPKIKFDYHNVLNGHKIKVRSNKIKMKF